MMLSCQKLSCLIPWPLVPGFITVGFGKTLQIDGGNFQLVLSQLSMTSFRFVTYSSVDEFGGVEGGREGGVLSLLVLEPSCHT